MLRIDLIKYTKSILTNYVVTVFIISGIALLLFYATWKPENKFPKEAAIAKFGGILYIALGMAIFIANLFFPSYF